MLTKDTVFAAAMQLLNQKIEEHSELLNDLLRSTAVESKSTAGDKHETGRAMVQIEQEKAGKQLEQLNQMKRAMDQIDFTRNNVRIGIGSLVQTNQGWYLFSIGLGWIEIGGDKVYCLSGSAPIAKMYFGKKAGDTFEWMGQAIEIISIS